MKKLSNLVSLRLVCSGVVLVLGIVLVPCSGASAEGGEDSISSVRSDSSNEGGTFVEEERRLPSSGLPVLGESRRGRDVERSSMRDPGPGTEGMKAFLDPDTGRITGRRPPGVGLTLGPDLREALSRSGEGLNEIRLPSGAVLVHLQGRFQHAAVLRLGEDDRKEMRCVDALEIPGIPEKQQEHPIR